MSQDGLTHFKNLAVSIFKVHLTILGYYVLKSCKRLIILTYISLLEIVKYIYTLTRSTESTYKLQNNSTHSSTTLISLYNRLFICAIIFAFTSSIIYVFLSSKAILASKNVQ